MAGHREVPGAGCHVAVHCPETNAHSLLLFIAFNPVNTKDALFNENSVSLGNEKFLAISRTHNPDARGGIGKVSSNKALIRRKTGFLPSHVLHHAKEHHGPRSSVLTGIMKHPQYISLQIAPP